MLHHAILASQSGSCGLTCAAFKIEVSGVKIDETVHVDIVDPQHPTTQGLNRGRCGRDLYHGGSGRGQ